jgi:ketosteroid isomerase-like protein
MTPRLFAVLFAVGSCLVPGAAARADDATVKEVEKAITALNEAFQKRDADAVKRLVTDDHVAVTPYYGGPATAAEMVATLGDLKIAEYAAARMKVTPLTRDAALVTYEVTWKGTYKGKELPRKCYASAVWVKRDGNWKEAFYQETALDGK